MRAGEKLGKREDLLRRVDGAWRIARRWKASPFVLEALDQARVEAPLERATAADQVHRHMKAPEPPPLPDDPMVAVEIFDEEHEVSGIDLVVHAETAYDLHATAGARTGSPSAGPVST